jgi:uncharacterized protein
MIMNRLPGLAAAALLAAAFLPQAAEAASFDCAKARTPDEIAICGNQTLGERDVEMATLYKVLTHLLAMGGRGAVQDDQAEWLKARGECGADVACLTERYDERIRALNAGLEEVYSRGPF